jgi:hypothetical protein
MDPHFNPYDTAQASGNLDDDLDSLRFHERLWYDKMEVANTRFRDIMREITNLRQLL